jgi:hypothetical protein
MAFAACWDHDEDEIDPVKYILYQQRLADATKARTMLLLNQLATNKTNKHKRRKTHKRQTSLLHYVDGNGIEVNVQPSDSYWFLAYVANPLLSARFHNTFRGRFRLPYSCYLELVEDAHAGDWFPR